MCWWVWMVVRFVCVIRVPVCAIVGGAMFRPLALPPLCFVSAPVCSTTIRPLTLRLPEPLFLHAPRRDPMLSWFLCSLACQAMWLYVLCLCVRHGPHACLARWLHGFRASDPGLTRGVATLIRVCERGMRHTSRAFE